MSYISAATDKLLNDGFLSIFSSTITEITHYSELSPYFRDFMGKELYYKIKLHDRLGYWPNLRQPNTFNEKITYRKLYTYDEMFSNISDKYAVRKFVKGKIGEKYLNELLYVTTEPESIPFNVLPDNYVIKATHGSGWNKIVSGDEDKNQIVKECEEWVSSIYATDKDEYWYSEIEPRIIIEEYLHSSFRTHPIDYKFFVFNGDAKYIQADIDRFGNHTRTLYNQNWEMLDVELEYPIGPDIQKPPDFGILIDVAEQLGEEFDFVRVDLYNPQPGIVRFGEMTLAPGSGHERFKPEKYDTFFGSEWTISHQS